MTGKLTLEELKGSRLGCLELTGMSKNKVVKAFAKMVDPYAKIDEDDYWMPRGIWEPEEARLTEPVPKPNPHLFPFIPRDADRCALTSWWLQIAKNANTPNWDIVSTCTIEGKDGIVLVEAKAHAGELSRSGKSFNDGISSKENHDQIGAAIVEANGKLNAILPGWVLSRDSHYQLCNRFAWAWKIASLGIPVVLVYLGFLNAEEMGSGHFRSHGEWEQAVRDYAKGIVPSSAWGNRLMVNGTPFWPLIKSADVGFQICP